MASIASITESHAVPERKRWTVEQFVRFYESGELGGETDRFELLDGEIYKKMGQIDPHVRSLMLIAEALRAVFGPHFSVNQQIPVRLGQYGRPEPDVVVLRGTVRELVTKPLDAAAVALIVEVADSRLDTARGPKVAIYAGNGIPEYWIVDLRRRVVEVRVGPRAESEEWTETRIYAESDSIAPSELGGVSVAVADLLPRMA
jgi:Uma2 family endonuclease